MKILVAVPEGELTEELAQNGNEVVLVDSLEILDEHLDSDPGCLIVDPSLEWAIDVIVRCKAKIDGPERDRLPVITVGAHTGNLPYTIPDAQFETAQAAAILEAAKAIVMRRARQRRLVDQELILKVPTVDTHVEKAGDLLERLVEAAGYEEEEQVGLTTTIREALGNAREHGNKNDPERTIHVNFLRTHDRVTIVVRDEGPGFNTDLFLGRAEEVSALEHTRSRRDVETRPGGLGVFIMKKSCDSITFNESGNSIYLMKFLPGHEPS